AAAGSASMTAARATTRRAARCEGIAEVSIGDRQHGAGTERIGYKPRRTHRGGPVPTWIMLSTLTPEGVQTIRNNPARIREVNNEIEQLGTTVKAQWATLGHFDFVNIVEAPDEKTMARVSLEPGSRGT